MDGSSGVKAVRTVRILIAAPEGPMRDSLADIGNVPDFLVCGVVDDFQAMLDHVQQRYVDVVLLDAGLPQLNGPSGLQELTMIAPTARAIVVAEGDARTGLSEWLSAGARGCVGRTATVIQVQIAINAVMSGGIYAPVSLREHLKTLQPAPSGVRREGRFLALTERQRQIMTLVLEGWDTNAIARHLDIGKATVRIHLLAIYRSSMAASRTRGIGGSGGMSGPHCSVPMPVAR